MEGPGCDDAAVAPLREEPGGDHSWSLLKMFEMGGAVPWPIRRPPSSPPAPPPPAAPRASRSRRGTAPPSPGRSPALGRDRGEIRGGVERLGPQALAQQRHVGRVAAQQGALHASGRPAARTSPAKCRAAAFLWALRAGPNRRCGTSTRWRGLRLTMQNCIITAVSPSGLTGARTSRPRTSAGRSGSIRATSRRTTIGPAAFSTDRTAPGRSRISTGRTGCIRTIRTPTAAGPGPAGRSAKGRKPTQTPPRPGRRLRSRWRQVRDG
jgi:hypothetical protein